MEKRTEGKQKLGRFFKKRLLITDGKTFTIEALVLLGYIGAISLISDEYGNWINLLFVLLSTIFIKGLLKFFIIIPVIYFYGLSFPHLALFISVLFLSTRKEMIHNESLRLNFLGSTGVSDVASGTKFYTEDLLGSISILVWVIYSL